MRHILKTIVILTALAPVTGLAKERISTGDFNKMIDSEGQKAAGLEANVKRTVSSKGEYRGAVVVANDGSRNPVKYNPFLKEDQVEVKSFSDFETAE